MKSVLGAAGFDASFSLCQAITPDTTPMTVVALLTRTL